MWHLLLLLRVIIIIVLLCVRVCVINLDDPFDQVQVPNCTATFHCNLIISVLLQLERVCVGVCSSDDAKLRRTRRKAPLSPKRHNYRRTKALCFIPLKCCGVCVLLLCVGVCVCVCHWLHTTRCNIASQIARYFLYFWRFNQKCRLHRLSISVLAGWLLSQELLLLREYTI